MRSDLDQLMLERQLDALIVFGPDGLSGVNAQFNYFVRGHYIVGTVFKRRGHPAQLVHGVMERDDAAKTGLELVENTRWPMKEIMAQAESPFAARVELFKRMLTDLQITGRVGIYGVADVAATLSLIRDLERRLPELTFVAEGFRDLLQAARETKDAEEIQTMTAVGEACCRVVDGTRRFLQQHTVQNNGLIQSDGSPLTIGAVKRHIRLLLIEQGLEHPGDIIFALGRDAGVPHNHGNPDEQLTLGRPMIFDIFPRRPGSYYHDMTRTWCLGHAPEIVQQAWNDVRDCFDSVVAGLKVGGRTFDCQQRACEFFESRGRVTLRTNPSAQAGYIHGLGHGLGLDIHESPGFPTFADAGGILTPGLVFTIEPGLYDPDQDYGVRLEDTYVCDLQGQFRSLTPAPRDLVVPIA